jgi:hypothetical protein
MAKYARPLTSENFSQARCPYIDNTMFDCEPTPTMTKSPSWRVPSEALEGGAGPADEAAEGGRAEDEEAQLEVLRNEVAVLKTKVANTLNASLGARSRRLSSASASGILEIPEEMRADDKASGAVTPVMTYADPMIKGPPPSPSASWRSPTVGGDMREGSLEPDLMSRRCKVGRQVHRISKVSMQWLYCKYTRASNSQKSLQWLYRVHVLTFEKR